jgi:serine/threonine protein kinase
MPTLVPGNEFGFLGEAPTERRHPGGNGEVARAAPSTEGAAREQSAPQAPRQNAAPSLAPLDLEPQANAPAGQLTRVGDFVVLDVLGSGAMGTVFKARHRQQPGILAAVKTLAPCYRADGPFLSRFRKEIDLLSGLTHPNIVRTLGIDFGDNGELCLIMEFVDGVDLEKKVVQSGPLPFEEACRLALAATAALEELYQKRIVHRDIKPSNLILDNNGTLKLADLGIARVNSSSDPGVTKAGWMVGSCHFMAPEQRDDPRQVDTRADIYSLGCTLYYLVTGQPPFGHLQDLAAILNAHRDEAPPDVDELRRREGITRPVPPQFAQVLRKAMAKRPKDRYQTPAEFALALQQCISAVGSNRNWRQSVSIRRQGPLAAAAAGVLLVAATVIAYATRATWGQRAEVISQAAPGSPEASKSAGTDQAPAERNVPRSPPFPARGEAPESLSQKLPSPSGRGAGGEGQHDALKELPGVSAHHAPLPKREGIGRGTLAPDTELPPREVVPVPGEPGRPTLARPSPESPPARPTALTEVTTPPKLQSLPSAPDGPSRPAQLGLMKSPHPLEALETALDNESSAIDRLVRDVARPKPGEAPQVGVGKATACNPVLGNCGQGIQVLLRKWLAEHGCIVCDASQSPTVEIAARYNLLRERPSGDAKSVRLPAAETPLSDLKRLELELRVSDRHGEEQTHVVTIGAKDVEAYQWEMLVDFLTASPGRGLQPGMPNLRADYAIEVVVGKTDRSVRTAKVAGDKAFVELKRGEKFSVVLVNHTPREVAAQLFVDGVSVFEFSQDRGQCEFFLIGPHGSLEIPGWHLDNHRTSEFVICEYSVSDLAGTLQKDVGSLGTITARFAPAWSGPADKPKDEPTGKGVDVKRQLGVGFGDDIASRFATTERFVSRRWHTLSVCYEVPAEGTGLGVPGPSTPKEPEKERRNGAERTHDDRTTREDSGLFPPRRPT